MARTKINVSNQLSVNANLKPDSDDGFSLGTTAHQWSDAFLASGAVLNFNNGDVTLTHASNLLTITGGNVRVDRLEIDSASDYIDMSGSDLHIVAAADVVITGDLVPSADDTYDLGTSSAAWQDLHLEGDVLFTDAGKVETAAGALTLSTAASSQNIILDATGDIEINADGGTVSFKDASTTYASITSAGFIPGADDTYDLGSTSAAWQDLHLEGDVLMTDAGKVATAAGALTLDGASGVSIVGNSSEVDITTSGALDLNGGAVTVDGTSISLDASDSSNFSMAGNSSSDVTLTIAASNSGSGAGNMALSADTVTITGNLDVNGTTTTIDTVNVAISDHNIILDRDNTTSNVIDGAGITMEGGSGDDITLQQLAASGGLELKKGSAYHGLVAGKFMVDGTGNHMDVTGDVLTLTAATSFEIASAADIVLDGADVVIDGTSSKLEFGSAGSGEHITGDGTDLTIASGAKLNLSATSDVILPDNVGMLFGDVSSGGEKIEGNGTKLVISSSEDIDLTATTNINIPANVGLKFGDDADGISANSGGTITMAAGALVLDSEGDITLDADGADVIFKDAGTDVGRVTMDGSTSLMLSGSGDIILAPAGQSVRPGADSRDSLGKGAVSASHSAGSQDVSTSGLTASQSISMSASGNHAVLFGSSLSAPSASSAASGFTSALQAVSQSLSGFSSTFNGTLSMGSYSGSTISAGSIFSLNGSSSSFYFVVTSDYSSGSSISVCAMPNVNGHSTSIGSISSVSAYSSSGFSGSGALSGVSVSAGETVSFTLSGGSAVFVSVVGPSSSTPWGFIGDPRDDVSSASTFSGTPSDAKAGGSITAASDAVAWAHLYSDAITMGGTLITATSTEINHLDGIGDATYDETADSVAFFDATDSKIKYEAANDFATTIAGDGLSAASGKIKITAYEQSFNSSSLTVGLTASLSLNADSAVVANTLSVYLNGMLLMKSGSVANHPNDQYDYKVSGTSLFMRDALDSNDLLVVKYLAK